MRGTAFFVDSSNIIKNADKPKPKYTNIMRKNKGFTLVEIMIVIVIIALLVAMAIPAFERARRNSQVGAMLNDMRNIEHGADQYFIEKSRSAVPISAIIGRQNYVKKVKYTATHYAPATLDITATTMQGTSPSGYTAEYNMTIGGAGTSINWGL